MPADSEKFQFRLLTKVDVARVFGVCTKTVDNYLKAGMLPAPVGFGAKEYWHPEVFREFIDEVFRAKEARIEPEPDRRGVDAAEAKNHRLKSANVSDSSAAVRQHARQAERLRKLNG